VGKKPSSRGLILATAEEIVANEGVASLTFDKIAAASGLSKGGILYHFGSKNDLVRAMIEQFVSRFETGLSDLAAEDDVEVGRYSRAYLRATFGEAATTGESYDRLGASITAALSSFPDYLQIVRDQNNRCQDGVENDGLDPVLATIMRLAVEGMWLAEVFQVMKLDPKMKRAVIDQLMDWTQPDTSNSKS